MLNRDDGNSSHQALRRRVRSALLLIGIVVLSGPSEGHRDRMKDIDHLISIEGSTSEITIEVVLHFHEIPSFQTRAERLDRNRDGVITIREQDAYCSAVAERLLHRYQLRLDTRPVPLIESYRAEIDLLDTPRVVRVPHLLKIFLTGKLPEGRTARSVLTFEDRSFATIPGMSRIEMCKDREGDEEVLASSNNRSLTFTFGRLIESSKGESSP